MNHLERVEVRIRRILGPGGESSEAHTVLCPRQHESKQLVDCEICDHCAELNPEESFVVCEVPSPVDPPPRALTARRLVSWLLSATTIGEVMTRDVLCVTPGMSVEAVRGLLLDHSISGVPVVDAQGFPVGVVSKTDLVRGAGGTVGELMMPLAFTLEEKCPIADAIKLMLTEKVHRLPVVDQDGRVVGIVSTLDVLRWLDS